MRRNTLIIAAIAGCHCRLRSSLRRTTHTGNTAKPTSFALNGTPCATAWHPTTSGRHR
jgi:hypothetical protein